MSETAQLSLATVGALLWLLVWHRFLPRPPARQIQTEFAERAPFSLSLFVLVVFLLAPPIVVVALGISADLPKEERGKRLLIAAIACGPIVVAAALAAAQLQRAPWRSFGLRLDNLNHALAEGVRVCVEWLPLALCVNGLMRLLIPKADGRIHLLEELLLNKPSSEIIWLAVAAAAVTAPIVEELVFRGMLQSSFNVFSAGPAILCSAIVFAAIHSSTWPDPIPLVLVGVGFGLAFQRTGNLLAPIIAHCLFNSTMIVIALSGLGKPR
jgi:membrane protease YdiL (CAAX protease family)